MSITFLLSIAVGILSISYAANLNGPNRNRLRFPPGVFTEILVSSIQPDFDGDHKAFLETADFTLDSIASKKAEAPYVACSGYLEASSAGAILKKDLGVESVKTVYSSRRYGYGCFILQAPFGYASSLLEQPKRKGLRYVEPLPSSLKFDTRLLQNRKKHPTALVEVHLSPGVLPKHDNLEIFQGLMEQWQAEITALAAASALSETVYWSAQYLQKAHTRHDSPNHSSLVEAWGLAFQYLQGKNGGHKICGWDLKNSEHVRHDTVRISGDGINSRSSNPTDDQQKYGSNEREGFCFMGLVSFLAAQHNVMHIKFGYAPKLLNDQASSAGQSGVAGVTPFWDKGINGSGQVVGIVDSGLDDASCFFYDEKNGPVPRSLSGDYSSYPEQRKVVQYISLGDRTDSWHGHGTHVAGSVGGSLTDEWESPKCTDDTITCFGECMSEEDCANDPFIGTWDGSTCEDSIGDGSFDWNFFCKAYDCDDSGFLHASWGMDSFDCLPDAIDLVPSATGSAPGAKIAFLDVVKGSSEELLLPYFLYDIVGYGYAAGARVFSNSWGSDAMCSYDSLALAIDYFHYGEPSILEIFAAGNTGDEGSCTIASPGTSKNALTAGATENGPLRGRLYYDVDSFERTAFFSSKGPTSDSRFKPDIVAPGMFVLSASSTNNVSETDRSCSVRPSAGTSMSCPHVAGAAALVRQYFEAGFYAQDLSARDLCDTNDTIYDCTSFQPSGALLKAVLINSGTSDGNLGPNFHRGHGRLQLNNTLALDGLGTSLLAVEGTLSARKNFSFQFHVSNAEYPVQATLVWMDPPATVFSSQQVLHDLDLAIVGPDCSIYYANLGNGLDFINNVEKVVIPPTAVRVGSFTVYVIANELTEADTQDFGLVLSGGGNASTIPEGASSNCNISQRITGGPDCPSGDVCCVFLPLSIGDGICDELFEGYNTAECDYDGGDCCPFTVSSFKSIHVQCDATTDLCGLLGYTCRDPKWASCATEAAPTSIGNAGDGTCDPELNTDACGFDMGDCCSSCCDTPKWQWSAPSCVGSFTQCKDADCDLSCDSSFCGASEPSSSRKRYPSFEARFPPIAMILAFRSISAWLSIPS